MTYYRGLNWPDWLMLAAASSALDASLTDAGSFRTMKATSTSF
jgi:hypothetical protein